jgi:hypothetical protein
MLGRRPISSAIIQELEGEEEEREKERREEAEASEKE